jgi:probable F420-dependent oxidoreductase
MARLGVRLETGPQFTPHEMLKLATLAEERGYETIWLPEGAGGDALTQLTAFATATTRVRLATGILPVFSRTPNLLAMSAGSLDAISQGRFILGLGVGHQRMVEDGQGVPFRQPMTRLRESVEIVRRLLEGERVTYEGRIFKLKDSSLGFTPLRSGIPIYLAALGPQMIELAGEIADGVLLTWASPSYLKRAIEHLHRGAERAGRNPEDIHVACYLRTAVVDDPDRIRPALQRQIARYFNMPFYSSYFKQSGFEHEAAKISQALARGDTDGAASAISEAMQNELAIIGPAEHCRQEVESRRSLGLQLPVIAPFAVTDDAVRDFRSTIEAFSSKH